MNRQEAEIKLKQIFGFDNFFDDQWKISDELACSTGCSL